MADEDRQGQWYLEREYWGREYQCLGIRHWLRLFFMKMSRLDYCGTVVKGFDFSRLNCPSLGTRPLLHRNEATEAWGQATPLWA